MGRIEVTKITDGLYVIPVGPVNTFLLDSPDGCALIDTGVSGSAAAILRALHALGKQPRDLRHIILTHAHPDHIGSLAVLKKITSAEVYIHPLDADIASNGTGFRPMSPAPGLVTGMMFQMFVRPVETVESATIEHRVQTGEFLPIAGGLTAIHVPGHCAGQLAFLWPKHGGVLFAADTCMNVLGLGWTMGYEDFEEGKRSLEKLARLDFQVACFGHGQTILHEAGDRFRKMWADFDAKPRMSNRRHPDSLNVARSIAKISPTFSAVDRGKPSS
jgi:glyoxylase-like metal-dependent hydrolase (beta-lactamase superfamily II)